MGCGGLVIDRTIAGRVDQLGSLSRPEWLGDRGRHSLLPTQWTADTNIRWKVDLPGPGSSSPIVIGNKIFVTCWTGYGTAEAPEANLESLRRHMICIDRTSGKTLWDRAIEAVLPEDSYQGMFAEHGYASHTPTSDGERVYGFFGKTGVIAFDMEGKELWRQSVGEGLDDRRWGSSSSPILYKNLVLVTASAEKRALIALDKLTGKIVWQQKADGFQSVWGTPVLVEVDENRTDLVIGVPFELWGFNPDNGELQWFCPALDTDSFCSSVVAKDGIVYAVEGRSGGSIAVRAGGKDDVSKTHVVWTGRNRSRIGTPVIYQDRLYFFSGGIANCVEAKTGKEVFAARLQRNMTSPSETGQAIKVLDLADPSVEVIDDAGQEGEAADRVAKTTRHPS